MFGKPYAAYIRYQMPFLIATAVVGLLRLALSIFGQPDDVVKFLSITVIGFASFAYYGATVRRRGFGTYRHLLPLVFNQGLIANAIAVLGIALSVYGMPNIYDAPEFRGPFATAQTTPLQHALAHIFGGTTAGALVGWAFASIVMAVFGRARK